MGPAPVHTDRDLASIAEARALARRAKQAWLELAEFNQDQIDAIIDAMAAAAAAQAEDFARLAVEETGYGVVADKIQKNLFSAGKVYRFIRPMKTVGVVARNEEHARRGNRGALRRGRRSCVRRPTPRRPPSTRSSSRSRPDARLSSAPIQQRCGASHASRR